MSTYRTPVLVFGCIFETEEDAAAFCLEEYKSDELTKDELGLEYFDEYFILGYRMEPGETIAKYQMMWDQHCFPATHTPKAMLDIRTY